MADTHGGSRENSGRRNAAYEEATTDAAILYSKSRAKEKAHKAKIAELEERKARKELVAVRDIRAEADRAGRMVKEAFTAMPDRVASLLVGRSEVEILHELRKEIHATLEGLRDEISGPG